MFYSSYLAYNWNVCLYGADGSCAVVGQVIAETIQQAIQVALAKYTIPPGTEVRVIMVL